MRKFIVSTTTLEDLASETGSSFQLNGQSENSMDPIDKDALQMSTLKFDAGHLAWITDDSRYFNCIRFHSEDSIEDMNEIERQRLL